MTRFPGPRLKRRFPAWLAERRLALAFTTCRSGKLFPAGLRADRVVFVATPVR